MRIEFIGDAALTQAGLTFFPGRGGRALNKNFVVETPTSDVGDGANEVGIEAESFSKGFIPKGCGGQYFPIRVIRGYYFGFRVVEG